MSKYQQLITCEADSLIELLVAQCADLQKLLTLARQESSAAEKNDFHELLSVTSERATLGERLESYHRQIAELRDAMGEIGERVVEGNVARESVRLITEIQKADSSNQALLSQARMNTNEAIARLTQGQRSTTAYLQDGRLAPKYDRRA